MDKNQTFSHKIFTEPDIVLELKYRRFDIRRRAIGVYAIMEDGVVVYIGYSVDVRNRIAHALKGVDIDIDSEGCVIKAYVIYVDDVACARRVERKLIRKYVPRCNKQYLGRKEARPLKQPAGKLRKIGVAEYERKFKC